MKNYNSPADALKDLRERGYNEDFGTQLFCLYCGDLDLRLDPQEFRVDEEYRFEGIGDHNEDTVVVAITSFNGVKGTFMDGYESYVDNINFQMAKQAQVYAGKTASKNLATNGVGCNNE